MSVTVPDTMIGANADALAFDLGADADAAVAA